MKRTDPERTRRLAAYLHTVARDTRKSAAEMDQMAGRMERELIPPEGPFPCCEPGPCRICGVDSPSGHVHILLPDSRETRQLTVGRICSSHSFWDAAKADLMVYLEGEILENETVYVLDDQTGHVPMYGGTPVRDETERDE